MTRTYAAAATVLTLVLLQAFRTTAQQRHWWNPASGEPIAATATYLFSLISVLGVLFTGHLWYRPLLFHLSVIVVATWTGLQWYRWSRRTTV